MYLGFSNATEPKRVRREDPIDNNHSDNVLRPRFLAFYFNRVKMRSQGSPYRQQPPSQMLSASSREKLLSYGPS